MARSFYHARRVFLSVVLESALRLYALGLALWPAPRQRALQNIRAEDLDPTLPGTIAKPFEYYRLLRDKHPVFRPPGQDFYCISRYEDIQAISRQTQLYSSNIVGVLLEKVFGPYATPQSAQPPGEGSRRNYGVTPVDVLAIQDPSAHKYQKLLTHQIVSGPFVRNLEGSVQKLSCELLDQFIGLGRVEFMDAVAWPLPMRMAMRLVGYPQQDYPRIKQGCAHTIRLLAGTSTPAELARDTAASMALFRYCWSQYRRAKENPQDDISGGLVAAAVDPDHPLTDEEAVSILFQLLIAGSDSSASTMGNAVRLLIEQPQLQEELREQPERTERFIEEVLRLESAFQGHFRLALQDSELHGVKLPKGSRLFLLWASGNRDERFWAHPDEIDLDRPNLKKHLTFGYGLHACLGRELARMEIRIVLNTLLQGTRNLRFDGPVDYVASLFTRTLRQLPIRFDPAETERGGPASARAASSAPAQAA